MMIVRPGDAVLLPLDSRQEHPEGVILEQMIYDALGGRHDYTIIAVPGLRQAIIFRSDET